MKDTWKICAPPKSKKTWGNFDSLAIGDECTYEAILDESKGKAAAKNIVLKNGGNSGGDRGDRGGRQGSLKPMFFFFVWRPLGKRWRLKGQIISHTIHVWYIYLHLP